MKGSVAVRRASGGAAPLGHLGHPLAHHHHHHHHHFPPMAVDSLHHHHANNHNSHQHMARVKAGVARTTSSSSAASSSSVLSSSSAGGVAGKPHHAAASSASSSAGGTGGRAGAAERLGGPPVPAERLTPRHFLDKYSLPRVVRVVAEAGGTGGRPPMSGPLAQPLLLYRQYSSCKVLARSLRKDKHAAVETGPPLVIPDSYQGWFSLVRERSLQTRAKVYTTMQQLVGARVAVFLSKSPLTGFKLAHSPGADGEGSGLSELSGRRLQYARSTIRGGQVLRLLAVFEDNESGSASARARRGPGGPGGLGLGLGLGAHASGPALGRAGRALPLGRMGGAATQYAQCLTARNESVFVPVSATGSFYAVATNDVVDADRDDADVDVDLSRVYQLPQLLRLTAEPLPVKVQLVCGPIQNPLPGGFTGLLVLEDLQQEDVILACTLPRSWAMPPGPAGHAAPGVGAATATATPSVSSDLNAIVPAPAASPTATTTSSSSSSSSPSPADDGKPVFLEMDADSKFLLTRPLASREAEARFFKTPLLRRVLAHCRERADLWSSQIKVTHHVYPAVAAEPAGSAPSSGAAVPPGAAAAASATGPASAASALSGSVSGAGSAGSARPSSEHGSSSRAIQGLFRVGARDKESSAISGRASSLSSGGTKKSQSFRYASPAMMGGSTTGSSCPGGKPPSAAPAAASLSGSGQTARGTQRGTHQLLQQLQSLPGLKNLLRRSNSTSPQGQEPPDVPLSVVFPELFGLPAAGPDTDAEAGVGTGTTGEADGGGPAPGRAISPSITSITIKPNSSSGSMSCAPPRQQLRFYADDLPYGRVADAIPSKSVKPPARPRPRPRPLSRPGGLLSRGRPYYDEAEDDDGDDGDDGDDDDGRQHNNDDDEENIYAEICECPRRGRGVIVSGARVILTTTCSEERRGYYTFASATSKDQYYTGGSDGTFSGTMSSSNPSNPEEDLYDNVC